jgi:hypothetical protein
MTLTLRCQRLQRRCFGELFHQRCLRGAERYETESSMRIFVYFFFWQRKTWKQGRNYRNCTVFLLIGRRFKFWDIFWSETVSESVRQNVSMAAAIPSKFVSASVEASFSWNRNLKPLILNNKNSNNKNNKSKYYNIMIRFVQFSWSLIQFTQLCHQFMLTMVQHGST